MLQNGAAYIWDDEMKVPYLVYGDQWVGFDDERSIRNKMHWLKSSGYGGAMVWTVDMDDFNGTSCVGNVRYPLIGAIREELRGISRGTDAKDVDWSSVATTITETIVKKPEPYKISISDALSKAKKVPKLTQLVINAPTNGKSNFFSYRFRNPIVSNREYLAYFRERSTDHLLSDQLVTQKTGPR